MKKVDIVVLILLGLFFSNCEKEEVPAQIRIDYELQDDVSPVRIRFSTAENIRWLEWRVNDIQVSNYNGNNWELEHNFFEEGIANVTLDARGLNGEIYFGNLDLKIPEIANKLILYGYYFRDAYEFNIKDDTLSFNFGYFNGIEYSFAKALVSQSSFINEDSVIFETPLIFDISGFNEIAAEKLNLSFNIEGINSHKIYFKINRGIMDLYYHERLDTPDHTYLDNQLGIKHERIFIISDWTR